MADDNRLRSFRTNDPSRAAPEPPRPREPAGGSDPLAELARLIGQSDPFAEFGRSSSRQTPQAPQTQRAPQARPAPPAYRTPQEDYAEPENDYSRQNDAARRDWRQQDDYARQEEHYQEPRYQEQHYQDRYQERHSEPVPPQYEDPRYAAARGRHEPGFAADRDLPPRLAPDRAYADQAYARYSDQQYADQQHADQQHADQQYADQQYDDARYADERHPDERDPDARHADSRADDQQSDPYYEDAPLDPHDDESYDDVPRARQRGGLATALALIGCAMLGTAGAYAYRSYYSNASASGPPPVITADNSTPTKVIPANVGDSGKAIQDRLATAGKEQVISKQEEPVALQEPGTQSTPRVVLPAPVAPAPGIVQAPPPSAQPGAVPGSSEPKRVRTVVIRPDGTDLSGRPVGALAPMPAGTTGSTRANTTPPAPRATGSAPGPLSLDPQTGEPAPAAPRTRTAAVTAGHVVQLSSQKSEAEAQASFRALQAKFPSELGGREPIIRRADLGNKGVFYRTMVGPFASAQEASQFCASYKAAGGQCVVPNTN